MLFVFAGVNSVESVDDPAAFGCAQSCESSGGLMGPNGIGSSEVPGETSQTARRNPRCGGDNGGNDLLLISFFSLLCGEDNTSASGNVLGVRSDMDGEDAGVVLTVPRTVSGSLTNFNLARRLIEDGRVWENWPREGLV